MPKKADPVRAFLQKIGRKGGRSSAETWREREKRAAAGGATEGEVAALEARRERLREAGRKRGLAKLKPPD